MFVVIGVEDRIRVRYLTGEEGKAPDFVLEVASTSTRREELGPKREVCARLGVKECCTYDPTGEHVTPVLRGLRLSGGGYVRQLAVASRGDALALASEALGPGLRVQGGEIRFREPTTGQVLLSHQEEAAVRREEAAARRKAKSRADAAAVLAEREAPGRRRCG